MTNKKESFEKWFDNYIAREKPDLSNYEIELMKTAFSAGMWYGARNKKVKKNG